MDFMEHLMKHAADKEAPAQWENRTPEFIVDEILDNIADKKSIVGPHNAYRPRLAILVREAERNTVFKDALKTVAETVLGLFPNKSNTQDEDS